MKTINSKTVLFITGAFVSNRGWDHWKSYFEEKGFKTLAPAWPGKEGDPAALRNKQYNAELTDLNFARVVDHYAAIIKALPEKPILIGHSLGGLISQVLLNRDLAAAAILIHPAPPQGVLPYEFSFLKSGWKAFGLFTSIDKTYTMSFKDWQYAFTNGMSLEEQKEAYTISVIPESKRVVRTALTSAAKVDFKKPHAPLLMISGSEDHIIPASLNYRNFKRYSDTNSIAEYKDFPGKNHYVLALPTWKEEADYILGWIKAHG